MTIILDEDSNYPYPLSDNFIKNRTTSFDRLWREQFSLLPPFDKMTHEQRNQFKEVVRNVYNEGLGNINDVKEMVNVAYDDGLGDGHEKEFKRLKDKFDDFMDSLK